MIECNKYSLSIKCLLSLSQIICSCLFFHFLPESAFLSEKKVKEKRFSCNRKDRFGLEHRKSQISPGMEAAPYKQQLAAGESMEIEYLKRHDSLHAQKPSLARHSVSSADSNPDECSSGEIEVGSLYKIDHKQLPRKSPIQLKAIRTVMILESRTEPDGRSGFYIYNMVSEKTRLNVTVIFPSILSLRKCFCSEADKGQSPNPAGEAHPALDEQFVMGMNVAGKVLRRYIPPSEFARQKHLESFWAVSPKAEAGVKTEARTSPEKKPFLEVCRSELKCDGLVSWGVRRKVRYIVGHREMPPLSGFIAKKEDADGADGKRVAKRPRGGPSSNDRNRKEPRRDSKDRWSKERYETAELKLVDIMQAKGAVLGNPILRPELRAEARKYIGDTGLLDHLLKHMAGKVVPQRDVRFRRRHNPEGAMEYWLEQADLIDLRRQAGVQDPYWAPPPGWKPGDGQVVDAACARELKQLKEQMADMKRNFEELLDKKHGSEEPLTQTNGDKACNITVSTAAQESLLDSGSSSSLQESYKSLVTRKCVLEEQLSEISNSLDGIQEEMKKLVSEVEGAKKRAEPEAEGKPRKVVRSGFRICKPQGTFLWPSNAGSISPQLQAEDFLVVPTPPSASSATSAPPLPLAPPKPGSPVKPMPQIRATVSVARADNCEKISDRTGSSGSLSSSHHDILPRASSDDGESELAARDLEPSDAVAGTRTIADPTHPDFSAGSWLALSIPYHSLVRF